MTQHRPKSCKSFTTPSHRDPPRVKDCRCVPEAWDTGSAKRRTLREKTFSQNHEGGCPLAACTWALCSHQRARQWPGGSDTDQVRGIQTHKNFSGVPWSHADSSCWEATSQWIEKTVQRTAVLHQFYTSQSKGGCVGHGKPAGGRSGRRVDLRDRMQRKVTDTYSFYVCGHGTVTVTVSTVTTTRGCAVSALVRCLCFEGFRKRT